MYSSIFKLLNVVVPIIPTLNWLLNSSLYIIYDLIIIFYLFIYISKKDIRISRKDRKKTSPIFVLSIISLTIFLVLFISKVFVYFPVAVMSDSMNPIFARGDVVILEKVNENTKLIKNNIILYEYKGKQVIHRIIDIEKDNDSYITKGDNNNARDSEKVLISQIKAVYKFNIPYIGFPSVLFSEFLNKNAPENIENK